MNQYMFIMQGPPGSGKTTLANQMAHAFGMARVYSTDDYFVADGHYKFDASKLSEAHAWNQSRTKVALDNGVSVFVANTHVRCWEARPYVEMAMERGIPVVFIQCCGHWESVHGVPSEKVEAMRNALEELTVEKCLAARYPWEKLAN